MEIKSKIVANKRLLVANRGEIAIRIFRAASELNIRTVAIYSHEDRFAMHRFKADEAYKVGTPGQPLAAYLDWRALIALAKERKVDAIHPGYGFLSENAEFAQACLEADIMFCGPQPRVLALFGDKVSAKQAAKAAGLPVIPGSDGPIPDLPAALAFAAEHGFPLTLKAVAGGGGKGIRVVRSRPELESAFARAQSEALSSFGRGDIYIEKHIEAPKHIEVQIMGDNLGKVVHLYDRDCSVQRRHQKVVEVAPALGIPTATRTALLADAVTLARSVDYVGIGTVEFLVDKAGRYYFLEVNPRIQVEHTVTELVTGIDLAQASIILAAGRALSHPAIGIADQEAISCRGVAVQCRITTESPTLDFVPDTGKILAYRPAQGFGVRLDEGMATSGGLVTPHYDSLLVKVTTHAGDLYGAARKMLRSLNEFRIRGVRHNIPLLINIISHPRFFDWSIDTNFLAEHLELFQFRSPRDRATRLLRFLADVTVNNPHGLPSKAELRRPLPPVIEPNLQTPAGAGPLPSGGAKDVLTRQGVKGLVKWIKDQRSLLLTDTTMRDAHQSLFATRLRSRDILAIAPAYARHAAGLFSLECWGGATFDTCLRFLKEDPWERLAKIREAVPNILLQMLLRGDNAVGYKNYPEWVVRDFIRLSVETGLDVFRVFDCLNNPEQMAVALDEVKKRGAIAEACLCYSGNILDPNKTKYTVNYYVALAKRLEAMGADILCIKDMAGLLRPAAAKVLIKALKDACDLPIHLHTHATSGNGEAMLLYAAEAGCDIIDGAVSSMSGLTSQPSLNALAAALADDRRCPEVPLATLDALSRYWESVRGLYHAFDPGIVSTTTEVYANEIPGGQYSNFYEQARRVGVSTEDFHALTTRYQEVNTLFGDIIKVTPSSKVVGDMALLLQKHGLTGPEYLRKKPNLDYPDSVLAFFKGHMGVPHGGFNDEVRHLVLGKNPPPPAKPPVEDGDNLEMVQAELEKKLGSRLDARQALSYRLYPKVYLDALKHYQEFGKVDGLPTHAFYYGLEANEEIEVDLEPGKTLILSMSGISATNDQGMRTIFFQLNGFPREIDIPDQLAAKTIARRPKADPHVPLQVPAAMPCRILDINAKIGTRVEVGQALLVTESMKMEYVVTAKQAGSVKVIHVRKGDQVDEGDLLVELE